MARSGMRIQTRAGHLIGLVTAGVLSVAAWEFGGWALASPPAAKPEIPAIVARSTDRDTVAQFPARIEGKPSACYVQVLHAARKFNVVCIEVKHAQL